MATGTIKMYNDEKGFGFIKQGNSQPDVFFHISDFPNAEPQQGMAVSFELTETQDREGRMKTRAKNVTPAGEL